jgi:hypothetical protein
MFTEGFVPFVCDDFRSDGGGVVRNAVLKFVDVVNLLSGLGLNRENFRFRKAGELCDFVNGLVFG